MTTSKKTKKIIDGFDELFNKYEEVRQGDNDKKLIKCLRELLAYVSKHQKILNVPDEYINRVKKSLIKYERSTTEVEIKEAEVATAKRVFEISKEEHFKALLEFLPEGKGRINH